MESVEPKGRMESRKGPGGLLFTVHLRAFPFSSPTNEDTVLLMQICAHSGPKRSRIALFGHILSI